MTITSNHNEKLKEIRKLARRRTRDERGRFVAEGEDLVEAAAIRSSPSATKRPLSSRVRRRASLRISLSFSLWFEVMVI